MRIIAAILFSALACSVVFAQQDKKPATPARATAAKSSPAAQETATPTNSLGLTVARAILAKGLDENGPVDPGTEFSTTDKRVYCITQIKGAKEPVTIEHRWYLNDKQVFTLPLPIKSINWRTQSYVTMLPGRAGDWKVMVVLMPKEEVLTTLTFTVK